MRPFSSGGTVRCGSAGAIRGTDGTLGFATNFSRSSSAFSLVQRLLAGVQFRFPLSELLLGG
jgi:hypothetical protein